MAGSWGMTFSVSQAASRPPGRTPPHQRCLPCPDLGAEGHVGNVGSVMKRGLVEHNTPKRKKIFCQQTPRDDTTKDAERGNQHVENWAGDGAQECLWHERLNR